MFSLIKNFLMTMGVLFIILIIGAVYFFVADPLEIRPVISCLMGDCAVEDTLPDESQTSEDGTPALVEDKNPLLNASQEKMLESIGVDPAALPQKITPEMLTCASDKLSEERVAALMNGSEPTVQDFIAARECVGL